MVRFLRCSICLIAANCALLCGSEYCWAAEVISATDAQAIAGSEGKSRIVYGRVKDVIWEDGGRTRPPGNFSYFFVYFEGASDFALHVNNITYEVPRFDEHAQALIGKLVRAEGFINQRAPRDVNPHSPNWKMYIKMPWQYAVISADEWPADLAMPEDRRDEASPTNYDPIQ